jgi:hypothetical protein
MPTSRAIRSEIAGFLADLVDSNVAIFANPVVDANGRVGWPLTTAGDRFLQDRTPPTVRDYRWWVEHGAYSAVLFDGALLQMTYEFDRRTLIRHRLAYVPCPFEIARETLETEPLLDLFDLYARGPLESVVLRSVIRFDYDAARANPEHAAAHLTVNSVDCRVPCAAPLRLGLFVDFIFRHFYSRTFAELPWLGSVPKRTLAKGTVTDDERSRVHLNWPIA